MQRAGDAALDAWSWVHFGSGLALGVVLSSWWLAFLALAAFEVVEALLRRVGRGGKGLFEHESWANVAADLVIGMLGWMLTARWIPFPDAVRIW